LNINFTPEAIADLNAIHGYIAQDNARAADSVIQRILQAVAVLENFPLLGRPGQVEETREFSISNLPYFAVYEIADETRIEIIAIMHTARQYPSEGAP
jgi:addiction module RelE/StbE family toxin